MALTDLRAVRSPKLRLCHSTKQPDGLRSIIASLFRRMVLHQAVGLEVWAIGRIFGSHQTVPLKQVNATCTTFSPMLRHMFRYLPLLLPLCLCTCDPALNSQEAGESNIQGMDESAGQVEALELGAAFPVIVPPPPPPPAPVYDYDTTQWTEIIRLDSTIRLDIRYATANNFMERVIYDCGRCFYRPQVARALVKVHQDLKSENLGLKMYDCYRPGPYQQRLWDVLPDPRYVANPKRGSLHSRGAAADLTIVHLDTGEELDMGTPYDFFGEEAYTTTTNLPDEVMANRTLFQKVMRQHGFLTIRTEWWHFNFSGPRLELSDWVWDCE